MKKIIVSVSKQVLTLYDNDQVLKSYQVSTALNGVGELDNTGCTPRGKHTIAEKFGHNLPINSVFIARQPTGEIYDEVLAQDNPQRDWILSRILWLSGCESNINKGTTADGSICDTKQRYIYIHGTPDTEPMGVAKSHGCVRMRNTDVIELFDLVPIDTVIEIHE